LYSLLTDATLFEALLAIDRELATTAQAGGCRRCAGRLDHASRLQLGIAPPCPGAIENLNAAVRSN
jgi:hypothetical protein